MRGDSIFLAVTRLKNMRKEDCCKGYLKGNLSKYKYSSGDFAQVLKIIQKESIPYTRASEQIMICSPVGNQVKYNRHKADVVLSGYSTAPAAAIAYLLDHIKDSHRECRHSFNTPTMRNGIYKLLEGIGLKDGGGIFERDVNPSNNSDKPRFLFTQMLCMISPKGGSDAQDVEIILKSNNAILQQANGSLNAWHRRVMGCLKPCGTILIMGNNAWNLLIHSWLNRQGKVSIDFSRKTGEGSESLYSNLGKHFSIYKVIHAAGIRYKNKWHKWLLSKDCQEVRAHISSLDKTFKRGR